jgi:AraC-like DNA-binding protein
MGEIDPSSLLASARVPGVRTSADLDAFLRRNLRDPGVRRRTAGRGQVPVDLRYTRLDHVEVALLRATDALVSEGEIRRDEPYILQFPLSSQINVIVDGESISVDTGSGMVISPPARVYRRGAPGWLLAITFSRELLATRLALQLGRRARGRVEFQARLSAAAPELLDYSLLLVDAIDRGVLRPGRALTGALEAGLVDLLLDLQPHTVSRNLARTTAAVVGSRVHAISDAVDAAPTEALTLASLARLAGCSPRALQLTFRDRCGMSPMEFVRRRRLTHARDLLQRGGANVRVGDVAARLGFTSQSHFTALYRKLFDESPGETVVRNRPPTGGPPSTGAAPGTGRPAPRSS